VELICSHLLEILMDILRHGPQVEVLRPASLRSAVANAHLQAAVVHELSGGSVAKPTTGDIAPQVQALPPSVITSKPAIRDHFKTGQRPHPGQSSFTTAPAFGQERSLESGNG